MWTLALDCSDVQWMPSFLIFRDQERVFDAYALRPLDRAAKNRLRQAVSRGTATTFGELLVQLDWCLREAARRQEPFCTPTRSATPATSPNMVTGFRS